jgi:hypothetical protein
VPCRLFTDSRAHATTPLNGIRFCLARAAPFKPYALEQLLHDLMLSGGRVQAASALCHNAHLGEGCLELTFPSSACPVIFDEQRAGFEPCCLLRRARAATARTSSCDIAPSAGCHVHTAA